MQGVRTADGTTVSYDVYGSGPPGPREFFTTDALEAVLPDVRIGELAGQAHEGMTTAPDAYAEAVARFLLG